MFILVPAFFLVSMNVSVGQLDLIPLSDTASSIQGCKLVSQLL